MATPNIRSNSSISDPFRIYQRAIELLESTAPESENDLLELCKKFQTEPQAATKPMSKKARESLSGALYHKRCQGISSEMHKLWW